MLPIEHDFLMIQPKPLSTNYSHLVAVKKTSTSQQTLEKIAKFTFRFAIFSSVCWLVLVFLTVDFIIVVEFYLREFYDFYSDFDSLISSQ